MARANSLNEAERKELMRIARQALDLHLNRKKIPPEGPVYSCLQELGGAFVTLKNHGRLRGCIGHMTADKPLGQTVREMAVHAATGDPRFPPVTPEELPDITIEISVLSLLKTVARPEEVQVGRDGVMISQGARHGVFLPQVPVEQGWGREEFLNQACLKAGLPPDAWRHEGVEIRVFTAEVVSEHPAGEQ